MTSSLRSEIREIAYQTGRDRPLIVIESFPFVRVLPRKRAVPAGKARAKGHGAELTAIGSAVCGGMGYSVPSDRLLDSWDISSIKRSGFASLLNRPQANLDET